MAMLRFAGRESGAVALLPPVVVCATTLPQRTPRRVLQGARTARKFLRHHHAARRFTPPLLRFASIGRDEVLWDRLAPGRSPGSLTGVAHRGRAGAAQELRLSRGLPDVADWGDKGAFPASRRPVTLTEMSSTQGADPRAGSAPSAQVALGRLTEERERMVSLTGHAARHNLVQSRRAAAVPPAAAFPAELVDGLLHTLAPRAAGSAGEPGRGAWRTGAGPAPFSRRSRLGRARLTARGVCGRHRARRHPSDPGLRQLPGGDHAKRWCGNAMSCRPRSLASCKRARMRYGKRWMRSTRSCRSSMACWCCR